MHDYVGDRRNAALVLFFLTMAGALVLILLGSILAYFLPSAPAPNQPGTTYPTSLLKN